MINIEAFGFRAKPDFSMLAKGKDKSKKDKARTWNQQHLGINRQKETHGSGSGGVIHKKPPKI